MVVTLDQLASLTGSELHGDPSGEISGVAPLSNAGPGTISFLGDSKYRQYLRDTEAAAVILRADDLEHCPVPALVTDNPYLVFAKAASVLFPDDPVAGGVHPTASVADDADVHDSAWIGPTAVIESGVSIGPRTFVGPGCVIGAGSTLGEQCRLVARVTVCHGTVIGQRVIIHPGAVIGADGFGLANDAGKWVKVPQLGRVHIGDDVEIGANTTVDRGALEDTVIADGVKLDNQIQVAHNVHIGENTAIAGCAGIAGSTHIGKNCTVGGGVGIAGHLNIGDNVHFSGQSLVTRSYEEPGYYSGNLPSMPNKEWRKAVAWFRRLDEMMQRLKKLEKRVPSE